MSLTDKTKQIQTIVGVPSDGAYGELTATAILAKLHGYSIVEPAPPVSTAPVSGLTERTMLEILEHEALVLEMYKDSEGIPTWGGGVTDASGHTVGRYKDAPATLHRVLEVYEWLLRTKYLPNVLTAFKGFPLAEHQLAAALSFHWNTGAIGRASWIGSVKSGDTAKAREQFLEWKRPAAIIPRRKLERALFFDGVWSGDGKVTIYRAVNKPSYSPKWSSAEQVDIRDTLREVMAAAGV